MNLVFKISGSSWISALRTYLATTPEKVERKLNRVHADIDRTL
jgi:hypothetical protein